MRSVRSIVGLKWVPGRRPAAAGSSGSRPGSSLARRLTQGLLILMSALALFFILAPQQVSTQSGDDVVYEAFSHDPDKDVGGFGLSETGLWSDGELFWTSGFSYRDLNAYELDGGARRKDRDVPLVRRTLFDWGNAYSRGLWSDGYTIWVVNHWQDKAFAYDLMTGERQAHREFSWPYRQISVDSPGTYPAGLWSDGETIYVALYGSKALQGINLATGERSRSISTSAEGGTPMGIWSDGRTIWVANRANGTINAYNLRTGQRTPALDFTEAASAAGNQKPRALWSDGQTLWAADRQDSKLYAYRMPKSAMLRTLSVDGERVRSFAAERGDAWHDVQRLASAVTIVAEPAFADSNVSFSTPDLDPTTAGHQINLAFGDNPVTVQVTNGSDSRTYQLNVRRVLPDAQDYDDRLVTLGITGKSVAGFTPIRHVHQLGVEHDISTVTLDLTPGSVTATVVVSSPPDTDPMTDGHQVSLATGANRVSIDVRSWVGELRHYDLYINRGSDQPFAWNPANDFENLGRFDNDEPSGVWSDGETWIVANSHNNQLHIYEQSSGDLRQLRTIDVFGLDSIFQTSQVWSDGQTVWLSDTRDSNRIYAVDLLTGARRPELEVGPVPWQQWRGLWSDRQTIWTAYGCNVVARDLATGARRPERDLSGTPCSPDGLWSDGTVMWIGSSATHQIQAFDLSTNDRLPELDFDTPPAAGVGLLKSIWSDGNTMWVSDADDRKLYAFNMPPSIWLDSLEVGDLTLRHDLPASVVGFDRLQGGYRAYAPNTVDVVTVAVSAHSAEAIVTLTPEDADDNLDNGHQVNLAPGQTDISVSVQNGARTRSYRVAVHQPDVATLGSDATLSGLAASGIALGEFSRDTERYSANVPNAGQTMVTTTVSASPTDSAAFVTILPEDSDDNTEGHQVEMPVGKSAITVTVLSSDGSTPRSYQLDVRVVNAVTLSNDATLSALSIGSLDLSNFDSAVTTYEIDMPVGADDRRSLEMTVTATPTEPTASVTISPRDIAGNSPGHQVGLALGFSEVTITVTSSDGTAVQKYRVRVTRQSEPISWGRPTTSRQLPSQGWNLPAGLWSDGAVMFVVDRAYHTTINAHDMRTLNFLLDQSIGWNTVVWDTIGSYFPAPDDGHGVWSDGNTIWSSDASDDKLYAFGLRTDLPEWARNVDNLDFAGNDEARGIWSDGHIIWVADHEDAKIYAYELATGSRRPESDLDTLSAAGNQHPQGLWSDGDTIWVVDSSDIRVYAYDLRSGERRAQLELPTELLSRQHNRSPRGIWSDGETMFISDLDGLRIHTYAAPKTWALNSWELSGTGFADFHPADYTYDMEIPRNVGVTTVNLGLADGAVAVISPADADALTDGHQINLPVGETTISIEVTLDGRTSLYTMAFEVVNADTLNNDTTLERLSLSGLDFSDFSPQQPSYRVGTVAAAVERTIVDTAATAEGAIVTISPADADPDTPEHEIDLQYGITHISIKVRSSDRTSARTYTVDVPRDSGQPFDWNPLLDITIPPLASYDWGSEWIQALWIEGDTIWVTGGREWSSGTVIYAIDRFTGNAIRTIDMDSLGLGGGGLSGFYSDGTTLYATNMDYDRVFAFDLATGVRKPDLEISLASGNYRPDNGHSWDVWSDGEYFWVTDWSDGHLYAYDAITKLPALDRTHSTNWTRNQRGIWSDGITLWVGYDDYDKLLAYDLRTFERIRSLDFTKLGNAENHHMGDMWSDGWTMWVVDSLDHKLYAYNMPLRTYLSSLELSDLELQDFRHSTLSYQITADAAHTSTTVSYETVDPRALVSIVPADSDSDVSNGHQVTLQAGVTNIDVTVTTGTESRTYQISVTRPAGRSSGRSVRDAYRDVSLVRTDPGSGTANPIPAQALAGVWSDGTTIWAVDTDSGAVLAFSVAERERTAAHDFTDLAANGNEDPRGIWANGSTMWVSDAEDRRIYAYDRATKAPQANNEIDVSAAGWGLATDGSLHGPLGIWSDGTTIWVVSDETDTAHAFDLAGGARRASKDLSLFESDEVELTPFGSTPLGGSPALTSSVRAANQRSFDAADLLGARGSAQLIGKQNPKIDSPLTGRQSAPRSIWIDGDAVWVSDSAGQVRAYVRDSGNAIPELDFQSASSWGLWSDGTSFYVGNTAESRIEASYLPTTYRQIVERAASAPLTAELLGLSGAYTTYDPQSVVIGRLRFEVQFSVPLAASIDAEALRDNAFEIDNSRVVSVEQVDGRRDLWQVTIVMTNADIRVTLPAHSDCSAAAICTDDGRPLSNSPSATSLYYGRPLTAAFVEPPESHDGATTFEVAIEFSKAANFSVETMRDHAFIVSGGQIIGATRDTSYGPLWRLIVQPDSDGDVILTLPAESDCGREHAICSGLLPLSHSLELTIAFAADESEEQPSLTASFTQVPASLASADPITVRLALSEPPLAISYRVIRDEALSVDGGTVTRAKRVDGRNDLWDITINPDGDVDVSVTIAARSDCVTAPVICAEGDRPLSESASVTIPFVANQAESVATVEPELEPEATPEDQSEDPAALTAAISNLPASLSSATPFIVRLSFSEPPANLSYVVVRDEAFSISGGTVTRAKRVDGRNDLWDITINPDGGVDVVVTIEARSDCETAPVICATGDRPLSENASVTIPWSPPPS